MSEKMEQLLLDFEEKQQSLIKATSEFQDAASALNSAKKEEGQYLRNTIRRLVGVISLQSGVSFPSVWVIAYHDLYKETGFHAVVESKGVGSHLDVVQRAGRLQDLHKVVLRLLESSQFEPKGSAQ